MAKIVSEKMGITEGARAYFANAPVEAVEAIDPPLLELAKELRGDFDYIHLFATSRDELNDRFPKLKQHLKPIGILWVSWPKGGKLETDLSLTKVIELGYEHGLVERKTISIDVTWSAIKFTQNRGRCITTVTGS